ncbi:hypothetical protein MKX01_000097 [Papaver californicum]|nr:hypothetical protein MKX01_000097 [Papaver californicum]
MKGDEEKKNKKKLCLTSISVVVVETSTFPSDITKTRLQLFYGGTGKADRPSLITAFKVASEIVQKEGLMGMHRGLSASVCRHIFYTPIRIVDYEHLRNTFGGNDSSPLSLPKKAYLGELSGVIAQVGKVAASQIVRCLFKSNPCTSFMVEQGRTNLSFKARTTMKGSFPLNEKKTVTELCDLGPDDGVCSVQWTRKESYPSIGTKLGEVQVWDGTHCKRVRTMGGHQTRTGLWAEMVP